MIISHELPGATVYLVGQQPRGVLGVPDTIPAPTALCHVQVASDATRPGFGTIIPWQATGPGGPLQADGVMLTEAGQSAVFHTADCPAVVIASPVTVIALHAGRPAMTPDTEGKNIIDVALRLIDSPVDCRAYITGAICGAHFPHDHAGKREQVLPFLHTFGPGVFADVDTLALDLLSVIKTQLSQAGVPTEHIVHDNICTYEHDELASHRRDGAERTTTNLIVVTKQ